MLTLHTCARATCRRPFLASRKDRQFCSGACKDRMLRERRAAKTGVPIRATPGAPPQDLEPHAIEAILARRAAHRRATRTGLRIEGDTTYVRQDGVVCVSRGAWGQRPGSELHHRAVLVGVETGEGL